MPSEGRRLHGFTVVSRGLRLGRQLIVPAILGGASVGEGFGAAAQWTLVILAIPSLAIAVAQWLAFRYRLEDDELIIDSGVLSRRRRVIPLDRVQNVDLKRSALERLAGVAELRLETASGGSDAEAGLAVLSLDEAHALQAELRRRRAAGVARASGAAPDRPDGAGRDAIGPQERSVGSEPETLLELSFSDLAIAGATSNEAGLIAAGLATGVEILDDLGGLRQIDAWLESVFTQGAALGITGALLIGTALVVGFIILGWLVSIVATVVRFWGFTLTLAGDDLRREYGLLSRHQSTVPLKRVQAIRIEQTLLRRPLGLAALKIETAGAGPQQRENAQGGGAEAYVPITRHSDVGRLVRAVFPDARFESVAMNPVHPVSRRRSFVRLAVPIVLAAAVTAWFDTAGLAAAALLVPAWFFARAQYRARAWGRIDGYAIVRGGVLTRTNAVIPDRKVQTLHLWETPFQRRWDLATLMIDTAGGGSAARAVDLHRPTARQLLLTLASDAEAARRKELERRPHLSR
ncbi:MAG: PH domain-containing protein [Longimicrobiales bacterium]|nr:PH domain-containing protein [Longimicrobiales bacterium]